MKKILLLAVVLAGLMAAIGLRGQTPGIDVKRAILNSRHDFRAISTATIKSVSGDDPCVFCHTPHNANPGPELWNQNLGTTQFTTYTSTTLQSTIGAMAPDDSSKLCLSCHDGTIALGNTVSDGQIAFVQGAAYQLPTTSPNNIAGYNGKGFADDHPFAFTPNLANTEIRLPAAGDAVKLEVGKIQCASCHDPHSERIDTTQGKFLVKINQGSALCVTCHNKTGWTGSAHQQPPDAQEDQRYTSNQGAHTGYIGVTDNACESCHRPHSAGVSQRLTKYVEENTCYKCHDASVTNLRIDTDFNKTYRHPVDITPSVHDDAEGPAASGNPMPETSPSALRHAECEDCHNPHMSKASLQSFIPQPPNVNPPLIGVKGETATGSFDQRSTSEYEICFKCHAESANKPQLLGTTSFGRLPSRQYTSLTQYNQRVEFTQSLSYHAVTRTRSVTVPSLRPFMVDSTGGSISTRPLNTSSQIFCADCHASDTNRDLGGGNTGARGPHGSNIPHLLERQNMMETPPAIPGNSTGGVTYSVSNYALCDKCHDVQNVIYQGAGTSFSKHQGHLDAGAACSTCHDPHASAQSPRLVNFDLAIVGPSSSGPVNFTQTSPGHGTCTLKCHGQDHNHESY